MAGQFNDPSYGGLTPPPLPVNVDDGKKTKNGAGAPKKKGSLGKKVLIGAGALIVVIAVAANMNKGGEDKAEPKTVTETSAASPAKLADAPADAAPVETQPAEPVAAPEPAEPPAPDVPTDHTSALRQAESYASMMSMSKQGVYDQLVSEYGGKFSPEAAQYAVDNVGADWNKNALESAESYSDTMHMSKAGIYEQLTSEFGSKFLPEEAQYAVDTIVADWNANALESAKSYQEIMAMSPEAIRDQLVSEYGGKFTAEEADYAVANLG